MFLLNTMVQKNHPLYLEVSITIFLSKSKQELSYNLAAASLTLGFKLKTGSLGPSELPLIVERYVARAHPGVTKAALIAPI